MTPKNLLLIDYSNLAHRIVHLKQVAADRPNPSWDFWRYKMFLTVYEFVLMLDRLGAKPFDVVLALDAHDGYWRRDLYAPYKADRLEKRAASRVDWAAAFAEFDAFTKQCAEFLPWKVISHSKCEADDVIATLARDCEARGGAAVVYSADSDYLMLMSNRISVWNPIREEFAAFPYTATVNGRAVTYESPEEYAKIAILTGQGGKDNVYNVKTPTDFSGDRKPGFGVKAAQTLLAEPDFEKALRDGGFYELYLRNEALISPDKIPDSYREGILSAYRSYTLPEPNIQEYLNLNFWPSLTKQARTVEEVLLRTAGLAAPVPNLNVELNVELEVVGEEDSDAAQNQNRAQNKAGGLPWSL